MMRVSTRSLPPSKIPNGGGVRLPYRGFWVVEYAAGLLHARKDPVTQRRFQLRLRQLVLACGPTKYFGRLEIFQPAIRVDHDGVLLVVRYADNARWRIRQGVARRWCAIAGGEKHGCGHRDMPSGCA
ncbi:hypothetical protein [Gemmatimonas sp.]|uniref:hypothetical protein n=1 Tax=Gemmatimonas sp. TaxID=1962908 RepID=UPI003561EF29